MMYDRDKFCHHEQYSQEFEDNTHVWSEVMCRFNEFRWTFWKTRKECFENLKNHMEMNQYAKTDRLRALLMTLFTSDTMSDGAAVLDCEMNNASVYYGNEIDYFALDGSGAPPTQKFLGFNSITGWFDANRLGLADCEALMERKRELVASGKLKEYVFMYEMAELAKLRRKAILLEWK